MEGKRANLASRYVPLLGIALLIGIIYAIGIDEILSSMENIDPFILASMPFLVSIAYMVQTFRLKLILASKGIDVGYWTLYRIQFIGAFYAVITPSRIGGLVRIGHISKAARLPISSSSPAVIVDKFLDLLALLILSFLGSVIIASDHGRILAQTSFLIIIIIFIAGYLHNKKRAIKAIEMLLRVLPQKSALKDNIRNGLDDFYRFMPRKRDVIIPLALSLVSWLMLYSIAYLLISCMGERVDYIKFVLLYPIASVAGLLPVTISGLGTREAALLAVFHGIARPSSIIAVSLLSVVLCAIVPAFAGFLLSFRRHRSQVKI